MKKRLLHILFWSVISAAFIGPGTVATAASAGAGFGYTLIWALIFSVAACFVLQEASARITAVSGRSLGEAMRAEYSSTKSGRLLVWLTLIAILSGCAAFEAGNILGAVAGISLISDLISVPVIVMTIGTAAFLLLWFGTIRFTATFLGVIVAVMGICFVITALLIPQDYNSLLMEGFTPGIPPGAELLVLGLIGTTVVPYNIFLGSGLKHTQTVSEMKISLLLAISLGGAVSVAVLLTGTAITGSFTFEALAQALDTHLGGGGALLLGTGLFGAGLSSTLTAALAASITAKSLLADSKNRKEWDEKGIRFRSVWIGILIVGLMFGIAELQPVPIIILAQALNGIILPVIAVILFLLMNNDRVLPPEHQNRDLYNIVTGIVVYLTVLIGLTNLFRAFSRMSGFELPGQSVIIVTSVIIFVLISVPVGKKFFDKPGD